MYPLYPPAEGAQLSMANAQNLSLQVSPDVLILPGQLNPFAKRAGDVLCINPGRLTKGSTAGTFAQMCVHPILRNIVRKVSRTVASLPVDMESGSDIAPVVGDQGSGSVDQLKSTESDDIMPQQLAGNFDAIAQQDSTLAPLAADSKEKGDLPADASPANGAGDGSAAELSSESKQSAGRVQEAAENSHTASENGAPAPKDAEILHQAKGVDEPMDAMGDSANPALLAKGLASTGTTTLLHRVLERTRVEIVRL